MLASPPNYAKFQGGKEAIQIVQSGFKSNIFGGPVTQNIRLKKPISNTIENDILFCEIEYLYGGGFYQLEGIPDASGSMLYDVQILLRSIDNYDHVQMLRNEFNITNPISPASPRGQSNNSQVSNEKEHKFTYEQIAGSITGFGRIIKYKCVDGNITN